MFQRQNGRDLLQERPIKITFDPFSYAAASVLFELGNTKVFCAVSLQQGVPQFLRGKGEGWLTAEYALLPHATHIRTVRDGGMQRSGRAVEISRVIGRSLRTVVDLSALGGEKTLYIDCDVLQADGGTRVASIIAASLAIEKAQTSWLAEKLIRKPLLKERIAALSLGIMKDIVIVDPDYAEDLLIDADFNFIMTESGRLVEIQGGAEKSPISWEFFDLMKKQASIKLAEVFIIMRKALLEHVEKKEKNLSISEQNTEANKFPLFSLKNRLSGSI